MPFHHCHVQFFRFDMQACHDDDDELNKLTMLKECDGKHTAVV